MNASTLPATFHKGNAPTADIKYRRTAVAAFKVIDETQGIGEFIVNTFEVIDYANERTKFGCCKASLQRKLPKGVWAHDWARPIAKTLKAQELPAGDKSLPEECRPYGAIKVKAQFNLQVQDGRDAFEHLKFGSIDEFSIGYYEMEVSYDRQGVKNLDVIELVEWSPVLMGCNPITGVLDLKNREAAPANEIEEDTTVASNTDTAQAAPTANKTAPAFSVKNWSDIRTKAKYLGTYAESNAAWDVVYSLWYSLCYGVLYNELLEMCDGRDHDGDGDAGASIDEQLAELGAAFDEFKNMSLSIIKAIFEGAQNAQTPEEAAKSLITTIGDPNSDLPAGGQFGKQLDWAQALVKNVTERAASIKDLRRFSCRDLSQKRREQLTGLHATVKALADLLEDSAATTTETKTSKTENANTDEALAAELPEMQKLKNQMFAAQLKHQQAERELSIA